MLKIGSDYFKLFWLRFLLKMDEYWKQLPQDVKDKLLEAADELDEFWDANLDRWGSDVEEKVVRRCNRMLTIARKFALRRCSDATDAGANDQRAQDF